LGLGRPTLRFAGPDAAVALEQAALRRRLSSAHNCNAANALHARHTTCGWPSSSEFGSMAMFRLWRPMQSSWSVDFSLDQWTG